MNVASICHATQQRGVGPKSVDLKDWAQARCGCWRGEEEVEKELKEKGGEEREASDWGRK